MKKNKSNLDERQELKLLKIEHNGCWFAFWGLLAVMLVQLLLGNNDAKNLAGEWIVFMSLCVYLLTACIKNGIWDRRLKPTLKTNTIASGHKPLSSRSHERCMYCRGRNPIPHWFLPQILLPAEYREAFLNRVHSSDTRTSR